jgi:hypothetical protein
VHFQYTIQGSERLPIPGRNTHSKRLGNWLSGRPHINVSRFDV